MAHTLEDTKKFRRHDIYGQHAQLVELKNKNEELRKAMELMRPFYVFIDSNLPPEIGSGFREVWCKQQALLDA